MVNDVLSRTEYRKLNEQFAAIAHGETFERTRDGYYVIPVGEDDRPQNAFVFIKGTISKPVIGSIMIIDAENEMELDDIRRRFKNARSYESFEIAEAYFGSESVMEYRSRDCSSYRTLQGQASEMRRGVRGVQELQERSGSRGDTKDTVWGGNNAESGQGRERDGRGNRYSIKEAEEQVTEKALLRENEHLKKMVASLKEQMKLTKGVQVKQADIEKLAGRFLREYRSSTDKTAIVNGLKSMFEYIGNDPERNGETAFLMAKNISRDVIENSRLLTPALNEDYAEVRDYLKNTAVYFPQNVRSDIFYELIARGKSQKQLNSGLKSVLKEKYEDEVADAAEARQEGNTSRYEQLVNALSKKTGMNVTLVAEAVESVRKKAYESDDGDEESDIGKTEEKKTRLYSMTDANRALESNNLSSAQRIINQEYAYKVDEYLAKGEKQKDAETKARSSIKDSITTEWKDRFLAANLSERSKIRSMLHSITVGGKKIYTNDDMARWIKSDK